MNDPRITQYALGELSGPERDIFESELALSEDLQHELNETIHLAEMLGHLPMIDTLPEKTKTGLLNECDRNLKTSRQRVVRRRVLVIVSLGALAACLLIAPISPWMIFRNFKDDPGLVADLSQGLPATAGQVVSDNISVSTELNFPPVTPPESHVFTAPIDGLLASAPIETKQLDQQSSRWRAVESNVMAPAVPMDGGLVGATVTAPMGGSVVGQRGALPETKRSDLLISGQLAASVSNRSFQDFGYRANPIPNSAVSDHGESYARVQENIFLESKIAPLSTFSIDVDTAGYSNVRRFLQSDKLPPVDAIRTEELVNYFPYHYPQPQSRHPFSVSVEAARAPWDATRELVRIGIKGREMPLGERPSGNLVFLIDVSGSMNEPNKLPLLQRSLTALVERLGAGDTVAIVVYAGSSGMVLPPTSGENKQRILEAIQSLSSGGSTNGGAGIKLAYETARKHFLKEGANRVILCTDGDFNVGLTNQDELVKLIEKERASGVFLSVLGFGTGNLKDSTMEKLADKGNGNYAYIDSFSEGRKVLVEQMTSTLFTIAKDVKIQVEFNPATVAGYRLVGYENRLLAKEDFNDDKKDAGEIGAGHTVTALYEVIPAGEALPGTPSVDALKYQAPAPVSEKSAALSDDLLTVKLRYKAPDGDKSELIDFTVPSAVPAAFAQASSDFQFAAAVAAFGMKLRNSPEAGTMDWKEIQTIAKRNLGDDVGSYRAEFLTLVEKAARLSESRD